MSLQTKVEELFRRGEYDFEAIGELIEWSVCVEKRLAALERAGETLDPRTDNEVRLRLAIEAELPVTFKYRDREGASSYRVVSPYELGVKYGQNGATAWCDKFISLVAWDHGREAPRHFRVERIEGPVLPSNVESYRPPQER